MAQFVGENTGELFDRHTADQRRTDHEGEVAGDEEAEPAATEAGGGVDAGINLDESRTGCTDQVANMVHEPDAGGSTARTASMMTLDSVLPRGAKTGLSRKMKRIRPSPAKAR